MRRSPVTFGIALAAAAALLISQQGTSGPRVTVSELQGYESALVPLVADGGRTIEQGVKPGINDLRYRHVVPAPAIAREARTWIDDLSRLRKRVDNLAAPGRLAEINALFVRSLSTYIIACKRFQSAAQASPDPHAAALVDEGVTLAKLADHTYDLASRALQDLHHDLGLAPSSSFPNTPAGGTS